MAIEIVDFPSENGDFMWFSSSLWDSLPGRVINKSTTCVQWSKWTARPSGDDPTTFQDRSAWYKKRNIPVEHQTCMCAYIQNVYIYIYTSHSIPLISTLLLLSYPHYEPSQGWIHGYLSWLNRYVWRVNVINLYITYCVYIVNTIYCTVITLYIEYGTVYNILYKYILYIIY